MLGSRFLGRFDAGAIKPLNRVATVGITAMLSALYGQRITDCLAGFRAVRRVAYLSLPLRADRYEVETEVVALALRAGMRVEEVAVTRAARTAGETKLHRLRTGVGVVVTMMRCRVGRL